MQSRAYSAGQTLARDVAGGLALTVGAVAVSAILARMFAPVDEEPEVYSDYDDPDAPTEPKPTPKRAAFTFLWPPLFLALTLSGLRIWASPRGPARTQALAMWGMAQALNTVWMAFGPRRLGGQVASTVATLGSAGAYAWRARRVTPPATVH